MLSVPRVKSLESIILSHKKRDFLSGWELFNDTSGSAVLSCMRKSEAKENCSLTHHLHTDLQANTCAKTDTRENCPRLRHRNTVTNQDKIHCINTSKWTLFNGLLINARYFIYCKCTFVFCWCHLGQIMLTNRQKVTYTIVQMLGVSKMYICIYLQKWIPLVSEDALNK